MFFPNPANQIRFFSVILESDIDPGYIYWTLTLKFSQYVCYITWESHCTKIIAARLLKLSIVYSYWWISMAPKYWAQMFKNKVCKKSYTSLEVDYLENVVTLNSKKNIWHRPQPWWRAFISTLAYSRYNYSYSPKKLWVQNCLKFISGNYNVCETMPSFIKNFRHVLRQKSIIRFEI